MPLFLWLASFLGTIFTAIVSALMTHFSKRIAIILAVVAAIAALTTGFFLAIYSIASGLASVAPPFVLTAWSLIVPSNLTILISAMLTARVLRWVYDWNVKVIQYRLF